LSCSEVERRDGGKEEKEKKEEKEGEKENVHGSKRRSWFRTTEWDADRTELELTRT